jgi:3-hydroxyisobutyrate dehydrogenase
MAMTIGCIGLGVFGSRVAARLGREGFGLMIHDAHIEPVRYFLLKNSADMADNPRMLSALCDVVISVLPDARSTREAALNHLGLAAGLKDGETCILVDLGTTSASEAKTLARELAPRGINYVEAPARGTPIDARDGRLTIPVGGDEAIVERALPVLRALGHKVIRTGEVGSAHLISSLVEHVRASTVLAVSEAISIGKTAGVSPDGLRAWCEFDGVIAPALTNLFGDHAAGSGHTVQTLLDNLRSLSALATENRLEPRHASLVAELWREAALALGPQRDIADVGRYLDDAMRAPPMAERDAKA